MRYDISLEIPNSAMISAVADVGADEANVLLSLEIGVSKDADKTKS